MAADRNPTITLSNLAPLGAQQGDLWINQANSQVNVHNGVQFQPLTAVLIVPTGTPTVAGELGFGGGKLNVGDGAANHVIPGLDQANSWSAAQTLTAAGSIDASLASVTAGLKLPSAAGAAPTADGFIAFDTTAHRPVVGENGTTLALATLTGTETFTNKTLTSPTLTTPNVSSGGLTVTGQTILTSSVNPALSVVDSGSGSGANFKLSGNGVTTPNKTLRVSNGMLQITDSAYANVIAALDDAGRMVLNAQNVAPNSSYALYLPNNGAIYANGYLTGAGIQTDGSVSTQLDLQVSNNYDVYVFRGGGNAIKFTHAGGLSLAAPTGGDKGSGTINVATGVYLNGTAYTNPDFVFEHWATGKIERYAGNVGAAEYAGLRSLGDMEAFARENWHLPGFGPDHGHDLFSGSENVLLHLEEAFLHLIDIDKRVKALEAVA